MGWVSLLIFGIVDFGYCIVQYVNMYRVGEVSDPYAEYGIFFILLSVQFFIETVIYKRPLKNDSDFDF